MNSLFTMAKEGADAVIAYIDLQLAKKVADEVQSLPISHGQHGLRRQ